MFATGVLTAGACSVVEEVMLQESFEKITTQIVCLYALSRYLNTKPELSVSTSAVFIFGKFLLNVT